MSCENEKLIKNTKNLLEDKKPIEVIFQALSVIKPSGKRNLLLVVIAIIIFKTIINIGFSDNTILMFLNIVQLSNEVIIPALGITFTGFSLFQALATKNALKELLKNEVGKNSLFKEYNLHFLGIDIIYVFIIVINFILKVILGTIDHMWYITFLPNVINNIIATILILIYVIINIFSLIEIKSFLCNIYNCFSLNVASSIIEDIKNGKIK